MNVAIWKLRRNVSMRRRSYGGGEQGGVIKKETLKGGKETKGSSIRIKPFSTAVKENGATSAFF